MTKGQIDNKKRFKAIQDQAKKLKAKNPRLTHLEAVKQAWAMASPVKKTVKSKPIKKTKISGALSLTKKETRLGYLPVKTVAKKAVAKKSTVKKTPISKHKDTKSHNVSIRVIGGINQNIYNDLKIAIKNLAFYENQLIRYRIAIKDPKNKDYVIELKKGLPIIVNYIKELKTHIKELKKYI